MRILLLGGTLFLGRHMVEAAVRRGHVVTLFNRGRQAPGLFPDLEHLRGDRDGDLSALAGRRWDAVIDTCGYFPRQLAASTAVLRSQVPCYVFVSSVNQYAHFRTRGVTEDHPSAPMPVDEATPLNSLTYGPLKAACEGVVRAAFPNRALILRPGCLVGAWDRAHRFAYWVRRIAAGGTMLVPGAPDRPWQVIDAYDVAEWTIGMIERAHTGTYNLVGPAEATGVADLFAAIAAALGTEIRPVWADPVPMRGRPEGRRWLDLAEWSDLPADWHWLYAVSSARAQAAGLTFRPLMETLRCCLAWLDERPGLGALDPETEGELLAGLGRTSAPAGIG